MNDNNWSNGIFVIDRAKSRSFRGRIETFVVRGIVGGHYATVPVEFGDNGEFTELDDRQMRHFSPIEEANRSGDVSFYHGKASMVSAVNRERERMEESQRRRDPGNREDRKRS